VSDEYANAPSTGGLPPLGDFNTVWKHFVGQLEAEGRLGPKDRAFLMLTVPIALIGETAVLGVQDNYTKEKLEGNLRDLVAGGLARLLGHQVNLAITVNATQQPVGHPFPPPTQQPLQQPAIEPAAHEQQQRLLPFAPRPEEDRPPPGVTTSPISLPPQSTGQALSSGIAPAPSQLPFSARPIDHGGLHSVPQSVPEPLPERNFAAPPRPPC
jgi:chromosomal replication initiator protein